MDSSIEGKDMSFVDIFVLFADVDMSSLVLLWWQWDTGMVQYLQTSMQSLDPEWNRNSLKLNKYRV